MLVLGLLPTPHPRGQEVIVPDIPVGQGAGEEGRKGAKCLFSCLGLILFSSRNSSKSGLDQSHASRTVAPRDLILPWGLPVKVPTTDSTREREMQLRTHLQRRTVVRVICTWRLPLSSFCHFTGGSTVFQLPKLHPNPAFLSLGHAPFSPRPGLLVGCPCWLCFLPRRHPGAPPSPMSTRHPTKMLTGTSHLQLQNQSPSSP